MIKRPGSVIGVVTLGLAGLTGSVDPRHCQRRGIPYRTDGG